MGFFVVLLNLEGRQAELPDKLRKVALYYQLLKLLPPPALSRSLSVLIFNFHIFPSHFNCGARQEIPPFIKPFTSPLKLSLDVHCSRDSSRNFHLKVRLESRLTSELKVYRVWNPGCHRNCHSKLEGLDSVSARQLWICSSTASGTDP